MAGRPTKLTPERALGIVELVSAGNYKATAAKANGVGESTLYRWLEQGEADAAADIASVHREFREAITRAEADSETKLLDAIVRAIPDDPKLALEILSRRHPARWARTNRPEDQAADSAVDVVDVQGLTDEALHELALAAGISDDGDQGPG